jgi:hypothetical protein
MLNWLRMIYLMQHRQVSQLELLVWGQGQLA